MTPLALLVCAVLSALSAQAKVTEDFSECERFFYKGTEPNGMDWDAMKICQKYNDQLYFATLYSEFHRIPLYSAYTFDWSNLQNTGPCTIPDDWFIEPQLGGEDQYDGMSPESQFDQEQLNQIKTNQAINSDYRFTGYDRGQLLPSCYLFTENRNATFTLTNAAPMDPWFYQSYWSRVEEELTVLNISESHPSGKAYIVTGTVPHENDRTPKREANQTLGDYERVTVPTHIWTAVCFVDDSDPQNLFFFSFGIIAENSQNSDIKTYRFPQMNSELMFLYSEINETRPVHVFVDDCNSKSRNQMENAIITSDTVPRVSGLSPHRGDLSSYLQELERGMSDNVKACLLAKITGYSWKIHHRKTDGSELVQCWYSSEKSDPASMITADGSRCRSDKHYCETKKGFKPYCTTPCEYQENSDTYWCYSGQKKILCSPRYSTVTIKNMKCKEDHPCGRYGEDYYWCKKASGSWDYCSPPLRNSRAKNGQRCRSNHACAKYGYKDNWCYTDVNNNWHRCCTIDDCFSAVNDKTCRRNSPCGYHGYNYLWCYTTNGGWDYCCKEC